MAGGILQLNLQHNWRYGF